MTAPSPPANVTEFTDICADIGQRARCCTLPIVSSEAALLTEVLMC